MNILPINKLKIRTSYVNYLPSSFIVQYVFSWFLTMAERYFDSYN